MTEAHPQVRKHRGLILSPLIYNIRGFSLYPIFPILGVFSEEDPTWII